MAVKIRAVQAYNVEERKVDSDYSKLEGGVCSIRILRDGTKAVTLSNRQNYHGGRYDSAIKVWDLRDGSLLKGIPPPGDRKTLSYSTWEKENDFTSMCITSDESTIATMEKHGIIKLWNLQSGEIIREWSDHSCWRSIIESCQDKLLISIANHDPDIKIWDRASGRLLDSWRYHSGRINSLCVSPDGNVIITGSYDKTVKIRRI